MNKKQVVRIGLKANACFLLADMKGHMTGQGGKVGHYAAVIFLTQPQFSKFKKLIVAYGGNLEKCLRKVSPDGPLGGVDYQCYFIDKPIAFKS